jgi:hypothetical protein
VAFGLHQLGRRQDRAQFMGRRNEPSETNRTHQLSDPARIPERDHG